LATSSIAAGFDVVPAAHDQVLLAAGEDEALVVAEVADVAGAEPSVGGKRAGVLRRIEIAGENLRTTHLHQAAFVGTASGLRAVEGDDARLGVRRTKADAARDRRAAPGIEGDRRCRLGHAVGLEQADSGGRLETAADRLGQDGATGHRHPHVRHVGARFATRS
jgi:hypothetical protein